MEKSIKNLKLGKVVVQAQYKRLGLMVLKQMLPRKVENYKIITITHRKLRVHPRPKKYRQVFKLISAILDRLGHYLTDPV